MVRHNHHNIRTQLRAAMERAGLTQAALAERTGVPQPSIARYLSGGRATVTVATLERLAQGVGCRVVLVPNYPAPPES